MSSGKKPRILFAANLYPEHNFMMQRYDSIVKALEGYQVEFVDIFDFCGDYEQAMKLERLCFSGKDLHNYFDNVDIVDLNRNFLNHILSYEWDILCLCTISHYSYFLLPSTLRNLSANGKLIVGFFGDDETMFSKHKFWVGLFDAVVAYTECKVQQYQQVNQHTYLLPIGVGPPPTLHPKPTKKIDVIFVGRPYGSRVDMIRAIKKSGINIQVFGSNNWLNYSDLEDAYQGFLEQKTFWYKLGQSKIVLNLMEDVAGKKPHINAKIFEAAMAGSLAVTTYYSPFETTYGLKDGKSIVFYRDIDDLIGQLEYYLTHDDHRERVAYQLQRHLFSHFAYQDLYRGLFSKLEAQWRDNASESVLRQPVDASRFSVVQFVSNNSDYQQAKRTWSTYPRIHVVYISKSGFSHTDVYSMAKFRRELNDGLSKAMREYIILASPKTVYDPATFDLLVRYDTARFYKDGVYCDSIVYKKRLRKSIHLFDLGSSIWRHDAFLEYAHSILRWYQFIGPMIPRCLVKWDIALMQVLLNRTAVPDGLGVTPFECYRRITDAARKLKDWLVHQ